MRHTAFVIATLCLAAGTLWADDSPSSVHDSSAPSEAAVSTTTIAPAEMTTSTVPAEVAASTVPAVEPYQYPVETKPHIVSEFGKRSLAKVAKVVGMTTLPDYERHEGIDFAVQPGAPVVAAHSGKVIFAGFSTQYVSRKNKKEKSRFIIVQNADGSSARYVHLNRIEVKPQQKVDAGDKLGTAADSDEWTQPVLHFEIRNAAGKAVNPRKFLPAAHP